MINGVVKMYDENSNQILSTNYKKNRKNTIEIEYYPNGMAKSIITYKDDKIHGMKREYYEKSGKLWSETNYIQNKKNGTLKWFYENGKVWIELNFINDKPHGMKKEYDENGKVLKIEKYNHGVKIF
jgi:antitoxin component YwqK of YwqJK toxin-antitoxin module